MWPFKSSKAPTTLPIEEISFSQLDITEHFDDNSSLSPDDWIETIAINYSTPNPTSVGLPAITASDDEVYRVAEELSQLRESVAIPGDGVYCPICHIANVSIARLRTPCPKCGRLLLKFGWT